MNLKPLLKINNKIKFKLMFLKRQSWNFSGGPVAKNPPVNAGGMDSIPDLGRSHVPRAN